MNKEDILQKSRNEKEDEGKQYAENKGRKIGVSAMSVMFIIVIVYNLLKGLNPYGVFALFWTYLGFEAYGKYKITQGKAERTAAIAGIIAGVVFLIDYIITMMG